MAATEGIANPTAIKAAIYRCHFSLCLILNDANPASAKNRADIPSTGVWPSNPAGIAAAMANAAARCRGVRSYRNTMA